MVYEPIAEVAAEAAVPVLGRLYAWLRSRARIVHVVLGWVLAVFAMRWALAFTPGAVAWWAKLGGFLLFFTAPVVAILITVAWIQRQRAP